MSVFTGSVHEFMSYAGLLSSVESHLEVDGGSALALVLELVVLAGENGVEDDAHHGGHGQTGEADGADVYGTLGAGGYAQAQHQDKGGDDHVAGVGKVHLVLNHVAHAHGGDHSVEHQGHAADSCGGHCGDQSGKLGAEAEDDCKQGGKTDDSGVIDLGQGQHTGVLTVGGVGRGAEEGGHGGSQAVAHEGAVEARLNQEVPFHGGGDGADIADVLHHGGYCQRYDGDAGGDQHTGVGAVHEQAKHGGVLMDGDAYPVGLGHGLGHSGPGGRVDDHAHQVGGHHAHQDGDDLYHALAPHVADDDRQDSHDGHQGVGAAVVNGGGGEDQADGYDDGSGDDGGEEAHDPVYTHALYNGGQDNVHKAGHGHSKAGIGQQLGFSVGSNGAVACQVGEGGAQEGGHHALGQQVEQQCAQACKQQGGGDVQPGEGGHQHGGSEHGEHVLKAQDEHLGCAKSAGVIDGTFVYSLFFSHFSYLSFYLVFSVLRPGRRSYGTAPKNGRKKCLALSGKTKILRPVILSGPSPMSDFAGLCVP